MEFELGKKIKDVRKNKNLSIAQLSSMSGVSTGLISQIERGKVMPSAINLWKISNVLDTNISFYFDENRRENELIVRKHDRVTIITSQNSGRYELLSPSVTGRNLEFIILTLESGEETDDKKMVHNGEECGFVLSGNLVVRINNEDYILNEGDSIQYSCTLPHKYINRSETVCESIWAISPPSL